jgi:hypothetical protein
MDRKLSIVQTLCSCGKRYSEQQVLQWYLFLFTFLVFLFIFVNLFFFAESFINQTPQTVSSWGSTLADNVNVC